MSRPRLHIIVRQDGKAQYAHILAAESALGKTLPAGAQVHHVDENPANNTNANLVVCPNQTYHRLLHRRTDALNACGNANFIICRHCHVYDDPANLIGDGPRSKAHRDCRNAYRRKRHAEGRNA